MIVSYIVFAQWMLQNFCLQFLKNYNEEHSTKIGIAIYLMKLLSNLFVKYPELNGNIIFGDIAKKIL